GKRGIAGGQGGGLTVWDFMQGEYIQAIEGIYGGDLVDELCIRTNRDYRCFGGRGGSVNFRYQAPPGYKINGFWGRAGQYLDAIGVFLVGSTTNNYRAVDAGPSGGSGGGNFNFIQYTRIDTIWFNAGQYIDGIGASYVAAGSPTGVLGDWAGGRGGGEHSLKLN
ncbi:MAG: hypothetical protein GY796_10000, partial [Chloroflexi bacterium]|nr:hypothetical protein [Chloroflexota bacterium]